MRPDVDMSPLAITHRLLLVDALWRERRDRSAPVDLSPEAVSRRLRQLSELSELCTKLGQAVECPKMLHPDLPTR